MTRPDSAVPLATQDYANGLRPEQLQDAYALPTATGEPGTGPTVAIVDAYDNPYAEADLAAYRAKFQLGDCTTDNGCFTKVDQRGGTSYPKGDTGWGAEIDLDIEMVSAVCPSCKILLVEADSAGFPDLMAAVDHAAANADFVSNSYGAGEFSGETTYDSHFAVTGVGFTVSSGDSGFGVSYPAASRYVTAVGGTSLVADSSTRGWSETVWRGAGSGCSAVETKPSWQHDTGCSRRTVADVSAVADPSTGVAVYDSYGSSNGANWYVYGGTSVAAPVVAGIWALAVAVDEALAPADGATAAAIPYAHVAGWFDVLSGTNTKRCRFGYLCKAIEGYDGPTGWGTPDGIAGFGGAAVEPSPSPSPTSTETSPVGLTLSASGYKVRGVEMVDLEWTGATTIDVYRNNVNVVTVSGSSYTDNTGTKGGATFTYKVCEAGTSTCSDEVVVTF